MADNIQVTEYTVYPTGIAVEDVANVKFAVENVAEGGTVVLKSHRTGDPKDIAAFNFGGDVEPKPDTKPTITIAKHVHIRGEHIDDADREWPGPSGNSQGWTAGARKTGGTTITGGRVPFGVKVEHQAPPGVTPGVTIDDIRFSGFFRCAIGMKEANGASRIRGCSFVDYQIGYADSPHGVWPIIADAGDNASNLTGQLAVMNNFFGEDMDPASKTPLGLNNGIHISNCDLALEFRNNRIEDMHFVGIAVYGNKGNTDIIENNITKASTFSKDYDDDAKNVHTHIHEGAAISFGWVVGLPKNGDGSVTIKDNIIDVPAPDSHAIALNRFNGGSPSVVSGNLITMAPGTDINGRRAAISFVGASWRNATCANNTVTCGKGGTAGPGGTPFGIFVSSDFPSFVKPPEYSFLPKGLSRTKISGNRFEDLVAISSQIFIGPDVHEIDLEENWIGPVSVKPANDHDPWDAAKGGPLAKPKAAIWWQGHDCSIAECHFSSDVTGWHSPPFIGCIYLDATAKDNTIEYFVDQLPFKDPLPGEKYDTNQIFDAGGIETTTNTFIPTWSMITVPMEKPRIGKPFRIWPIDHVGPTPEEERRMRHTLEIALDNERRQYPDFEKYEAEMSGYSTLIPAGSVEVVEEYIHSLYLLAKSNRG